MLFRWNDWNVDHILKHQIDPIEAEAVVIGARNPFPQKIGDEKWLVIGPGQGGRWLQIIFIYDPDDVTVYIIHGRLLNDREKRRIRRRRR